MVLTWDQNPEEVYDGIVLADTLNQLFQDDKLTLFTDEPRSEEMDFPEKNLRVLAEAGLLGIKTPKEFGGLGLDTLNATYVIEQVARYAPATAFVLLLHALTVNRIEKAGTAAQKDRYLRAISQNTLAASAWSESGVGSDKSVLNTKAFLENGDWHLNGAKAFCTGAGHAGVYMVMTDTTDGKAFFLVPSDNPGLRIGLPMDSMGLQGTHSGALSLENALVPDTERVGEPGGIGPIIDFDMKAGLHSGIVASGIALGSFSRLVDIAKANGSFEKFESVRVRVSQLAVTLSIMRSHVYALAHMASVPEGARPPIESATMTAKFFLSEAALEMTSDAIAIAGKAGYLRENGLERLHRDALGIVVAAPINGQVLGSVSRSLQAMDRSSHLYNV